MGLDMLFYTKTSENDKDETEIYYFRKHSELHGWLMEKYLDENPEKTREDFNCLYFLLTKEIVQALEKYCERKYKTHYDGFFWGESSKEDWEKTKKILIPKMYKALEEGLLVFYYPWW